jgi:hypothetical protein
MRHIALASMRVRAPSHRCARVSTHEQDERRAIGHRDEVVVIDPLVDVILHSAHTLVAERVKGRRCSIHTASGTRQSSAHPLHVLCALPSSVLVRCVLRTYCVIASSYLICSTYPFRLLMLVPTRSPRGPRAVNQPAARVRDSGNSRKGSVVAVSTDGPAEMPDTTDSGGGALCR